MPAPPNPFYNPTTTSSSAPPPRYASPNNPTQSNEPQVYGSLSDLTRSRPAVPSRDSYTYTPKPERAGYRPDAAVGSGVQGRRMPPAPGNYGVEPQPPPKRNAPVVPDRPRPPTQTSYLSQAAGYVPNSVSATAMSMGDKVKDGWSGVATKERQDSVMSGVSKLGAGAAKLGGKAAWSISKFAASSGSK